MPDKKTLLLHVRIVSPKKVIFEGDVLSVSSVNSSGKFDILPFHANFLTLIENKPIYVRKPNKEMLTFNFAMAIIYNRESRVDIYTDIQISKEDLER